MVMFKNITVGSLKQHQNADENSTAAKNRSHPLGACSKPNVIRVVQKENRFEVPHVPGGTLLDTALDNRQTLEYKCRKGSCGLCKIKVVCGSNLLEDPNKKEKKLLSEEVERGFRLACQTKMKPGTRLK